MIKQNHELCSLELRALESLCEACKKEDGHIPAVYIHRLGQPRLFPCNIFYYEQDQLIGFLTTFFFQEETCEVAVLVSPSHRKQGIAKAMLTHILPLLQAQQIKTLLFSVPKQDNMERLKAMGYQYERSECQMMWTSRRLDFKPFLTVRSALHSDLEALCAIDKACFSTDLIFQYNRLEALLMSPAYKILIAFKEGEPIGKAHIMWQPGGARLSDVGVLPAFQRQGYGHELMNHCLKCCQDASRKKVWLDVEGDNLKAFRLYQGLGFYVNNAYEFWGIPLSYWENRTGYLSHI